MREKVRVVQRDLTCARVQPAVAEGDELVGPRKQCRCCLHAAMEEKRKIDDTCFETDVVRQEAPGLPERTGVRAGSCSTCSTRWICVVVPGSDRLLCSRPDLASSVLKWALWRGSEFEAVCHD